MSLPFLQTECCFHTYQSSETLLCHGNTILISDIGTAETIYKKRNIAMPHDEIDTNDWILNITEHEQQINSISCDPLVYRVSKIQINIPHKYQNYMHARICSLACTHT